MQQNRSARPRTDRVAVVVYTAARRGARALPLVEATVRGVSDDVTVHPVHGGLGLLDALAVAVNSVNRTLSEVGFLGRNSGSMDDSSETSESPEPSE